MVWWTRKKQPERDITTLEQYIAALNTFQFNNSTYGLTGISAQQTLNGSPAERIANSLEGYAQSAYMSNGPVFACMAVRMLLFSAIELQFQNRTTRELYGTGALSMFEKPWLGGTTQHLLTQMIQYADLAGNAYVAPIEGELVVMRPDWVTIALRARIHTMPDGRRGIVGYKKIGYQYEEGGYGATNNPVQFLPDEVAHFAPLPDPLASYRGMSWLTPIIREIKTDGQMNHHKQMFFENAATPNMVVKAPEGMNIESFREFIDEMDKRSKGVDAAYKTLYIGGGADATVVGSNMQQMSFKTVQGAGEPLALDTPVPTPTGWSTMGDIRPGDQVFGRDGKPVNVLGVSPVHVNRECYRVTLKDRTSIVADASHIWTYMDRQTARREERSATMRALYELYRAPFKNGVGGYRLSLPSTPVVELPDADLLIDPYVLGAWLGDGQTAGAAICGAADDLKYIAAQIEDRGYTTTKWQVAEDKCDVIGIPGGLLAALRVERILGDKRIPQMYLRASVSQRLDLLRGLMDTDGTVDNSGKGTCQFTSKWEHLARQVAELIRSLGYRATLTWSADVRSRTGGTWSVFFRVAQDRIPFLLPRKVDRCVNAGDPHVGDNKQIVSIEPVESVPVRCIAVDSPDHLFLAGEGFVPTHNTRIASAAGVPPIIVGMSEGLQSATYSNYSQARRRLADMTMHPLWQNASGALGLLTQEPVGSRLWYDARHIPFLREDERDAADIMHVKASSIRLFTDAGFIPKSAVSSVDTEDLNQLEHSGLFSVQLIPPGTFNKNLPPSAGGAGSPVLPGDVVPALPGVPKREDDRAVSKLPYGPGHPLWEYWTKGKGLAKWAGAVHKWTTLHKLLKEEGVPTHMLDGLTTNIIEHVFPGYMKEVAHKKKGKHSLDDGEEEEL